MGFDKVSKFIGVMYPMVEPVNHDSDELKKLLDLIEPDYHLGDFAAIRQKLIDQGVLKPIGTSPE